MAQSQHVRPVEDNSNADTEAMIAAAGTRKFTVRDGKVQMYNNGRYVDMPTIPGFAALGAAGPLVLSAVHQYIKNRIVKMGEGDVQSLVNNAILSGVIPGANSDDPEEEAFVDWIADLVESKLGALASDASKTDKEARSKIVEDSANKYRTPERISAAVKLAREYARAVPTTDKKKRQLKAADTSSAVELEL